MQTEETVQAPKKLGRPFASSKSDSTVQQSSDVQEQYRQSLTTVMIPVCQAILHKALMIAGKTESNLTKDKVPGIKAMGWTQTGAFLIEETAQFKGRRHLLPSAAVADSILTD